MGMTLEYRPSAQVGETSNGFHLQSDSLESEHSSANEQGEGVRVEQHNIRGDAVFDQGRDLICTDVHH